MPFCTRTPALHGPHLSHHLVSQPTGPPFCQLLSLALLPSDTSLQSFALWPSGAPTELGSLVQHDPWLQPNHSITGISSISQLAQFDIQSRNLFYPAPYIHAPSTVSVRALLRLRTQASPHIPAHCKLSKPTAGPATYRAFQERPCPDCPLAVGESSHYLLT